MFRSLCFCLRFPSRLRRRARRSRIITMIIIFLVVFCFIYPFYVIYKPPTFLIRYFQRRWPDVLWHVSTNEKVIALTIDDAPSQFTSEILEILRENDAQATFFVIGGQVQAGGQEVLKEIVRNGHELGNHAMHDEASRSLADSVLESEIKQVEGMIHEAYDAEKVEYPPRYFRPGSGFYSDRMRALVAELGYRIVLGNIYPHDPQIPYPKVNAAHVLSMVKPGGIIICHDRRGWTVPMLRRVVPEIKRRGYRITSISGLLKKVEGEKGPAKED